MPDDEAPAIHETVRHQGHRYEVLGHRRSGAEVWIVADNDAKWVPTREVEPVD